MTPLHLHSDTVPLANQVAGHQNVLSDASGSLVIKPALPREIAFYQTLSSSRKTSSLSRLKSFVPLFYGTLRLQGRITSGYDGIVPVSGGEVAESVVLENLAHAYTHPSILDVKLGTVLYSPDASLEKRERMERASRGSTSWETGIRLTGCQTWHAPSQFYIFTPKSFGKSITPAQLPSGMTRYFPLPTDTIPSLIIPSNPVPPTPITASSTCTPMPISHLPLIPESTVPDSLSPLSAFSATPSEKASVSALLPDVSISSSNAGRSVLAPSAEPSVASSMAKASATLPTAEPTPPAEADISSIPTSATSSFRPTSYTNHALPAPLLIRVLTLLEEQLVHLLGIIENLEARFIGSSVLIVYEGDPDRLRDALDRWDARPMPLPPPHLHQPHQDDEEEEEEEDYDDLESESSSTSSSDAEDDGTRSDARKARRCPPLTVKMIDFAHTRLCEGEGRDEGVVLGLKTLVGLVRGRLEEVERSCNGQTD